MVGGLHNLMRTTRLNTKRLAVAAGIILFLAVGYGVYLFVRPTPPVVEATKHFARLQVVISKLNDSLGKQSPTGQVVTDYLEDLRTIRSECDAVRQIYRAEKLSYDEKTTLKPSSELCSELATLAKHSELYYTPLLPILSQSTTVMRYQTLWPLTNYIRDKDIKVVKEAQQKFEEITPYADAYPTQIPALTTQLAKDIAISKNLHYMPTLRIYQQQILAERQQYWTAYADIADLKRELSVQKSHMCELPHVTPNRWLCKSSRI